MKITFRQTTNRITSLTSMTIDQKMRTSHFLQSFCSIILALIFMTGCAPENHTPQMIPTSIAGDAITRGQKVSVVDEISQRTVMVLQSFEIKKNKPMYFNVCTGLIMSPYYIVTAAHCVKNKDTDKIVFTIDIHNEKKLKEKTYSIKKIFIHENYQKNYDRAQSIVEKTEGQINPLDIINRYDIALIQVDRPLKNAIYDKSYFIEKSLSQFLKTQYSDLNSVWLDVMLAGYGSSLALTTDNAQLNQYVLQQALTSMNLQQLTQRTFTYNQKNKAGVCTGDSGSPLFIKTNNKLIPHALATTVFFDPQQIRSRYDTVCNSRSVFLNLDYFKEWILEKMLSTDAT